jgi:hypothetical protein
MGHSPGAGPGLLYTWCWPSHFSLLLLSSFSPHSSFLHSPIYILIPCAQFPIPNQIRQPPSPAIALTALVHPIPDWPRSSRLFILLFLASWKTILYGNRIWIQDGSTGCVRDRSFLPETLHFWAVTLFDLWFNRCCGVKIVAHNSILT